MQGSARGSRRPPPAAEHQRVAATPVGQLAGRVVLVEEAAAHAVAEALAEAAEVEHGAVGHVLAAEVADALDDGGGTGVADREPVARLALRRTAARRWRRTGRSCRSARCRRVPASPPPGVRTTMRAAAHALADAVVGGAGVGHDHAVVAEQRRTTARPSRCVVMFTVPSARKRRPRSSVYAGRRVDALVVEHPLDVDRHLAAHATCCCCATCTGPSSIAPGRRLSAARISSSEGVVVGVVGLQVDGLVDDLLRHLASIARTGRASPTLRRVVHELQQVGPAAGLAQRLRRPSVGEDLADLVGDVEQVLRERPRVTVEHLRVGGDPRRALDVAVLRHHAAAASSARWCRTRSCRRRAGPR